MPLGNVADAVGAEQPAVDAGGRARDAAEDEAERGLGDAEPEPPQVELGRNAARGVHRDVLAASRQASTPSCRPTFVNAATARSMCSGVCAAESWTRMRDWPARHDREEEALHVDALVEQRAREALRERRVVGREAREHDRHDRVDAGPDLEAGRGHALAEATACCASSRSRSSVAGVEQLERAQRGARHDRRRACSRTGTAGCAGAAGRRSPGRAAVQPPDAPPSALPNVVVRMSTRPATPQCSGVPRPVLPMKPVAWRVVHHHERAGACRPGRRSSASGATSPSIEKTPSVTIIRKRADARLLQLGLEVAHVDVLVDEALRLAQPHAVDDRGVVELVGEDRVVRAEQRLEDAAVRVEAGRVEDRVLHAEERGDPLLELAVQRLRAADEAHAREPVAPLRRAPACAAASSSGWLERPR